MPWSDLSRAIIAIHSLQGYHGTQYNDTQHNDIQYNDADTYV